MQRPVDIKTKYGFVRKIGDGSFGNTWMVLSLQTTTTSILKHYVLKQLAIGGPHQNSIKEVEAEATILSKMKHPNIVSYIESFHSTDSYFNIVMTYCEGGDLHQRIIDTNEKNRSLSEAQITEWFIQTSMALQHIHGKHIIHRDVKASNIFLTKNDVVKLGDFGISRRILKNQELAKTQIGTPYYLSPELCQNRSYGKKSDMWALGCCLFEMMELKHCFDADNMNGLIMRIVRASVPPMRGNYNKSLKNLVKALLSREPRARPSAGKILCDPYIVKHMVRLLGQTQTVVEAGDFGTPSQPCPEEVERKLDIDKDLQLDRERMLRRQKERLFKTDTSLTAASPTSVVMTSASAVSVTDIRLDADNNYDIDEDENESEPEPVEMVNRYMTLLDEDVNQLAMCNAKTPSENPTVSNQQTSHNQSEADVQLPLEKNIHRRYWDIGTLPTQVLLPVTGYNDSPLVSLHQAMEPVREFLDDIDVKIAVAKANTQRHLGILSSDEAAAIQLYTMESMPLERCVYFILNKTLRTANRRGLVPWFPYLKLLLTALWKLPSVRSIVWRGIRNVNLSDEYVEGNHYTWWNLSSCTDTLTVMETPQFLGNTGLRTLFSVECENGKDIKDYSYVSNEKEILLPPGTYFKVCGKLNPTPDLFIIHVKEVKPPYELIVPPY
ncbi:unnamed protein product [Rotaria magnacalcarata]